MPFEVQVTGNQLSYSSYPLKFPRIEELRSIPASKIELVFAGNDYEVLLRNGLVVLFPREKEIALREFVRRNGIRVVKGPDVWDLLNEPFLDTEFTDQETQATIATLHRLGFESEEVEAIRKKIGPVMTRHNAFAWEWISLGLRDVMHWHSGAPEEFADWAFAIAARGYRRATPFDLTARQTQEEQTQWLHEQWSYFCARKWFRAYSGLENISQRITTQDSVLAGLRRSYSEPQRHYHDTSHLQQVISLLNSFGPMLTAPALLAGWFHDSVYVPELKDNEEQSVAAMETQIRVLDPDPDVVRRARELILYTKDHRPTGNREERMIHDADLGIFGLDRDSYAKYASDIRREYAFVPEDAFKKGRTEILERFLRQAHEQGRWFYGLDPILEENVEGNLEWELALLRR